VLLAALCLCGCSLLPDIAHQPTVHNPFPQLSKVAIAPFFNLSNEPTVDGRAVAMAYFNELQLVPGFEVIPVGVVERAMAEEKITLRGPEEARRLAQIVGADALVVGAVTDFSPYYPPRCGLQVEWYAANPGFHPIPPGYGLPWGTPEEEQIPAPLVFEAEMALAREQLKTQTPRCGDLASVGDTGSPKAADGGRQEAGAPVGQASPGGVQTLQYAIAVPEKVATPAPTATAGAAATADRVSVGVPADWPDPQGFIPPPPSPVRPPCRPSDLPVIEHTKTYNGHDMEFTEALASYYYFRDDARFGGWQGYLQRSDDFTRFCCHMHIWEMLSARGGVGETRVVWRWPAIR